MPASPLGSRTLSGEGVFRPFEALVEELDVAVEAGHLTAKGRIGLVRRCGPQGGSFGLEPGAAEHGSQHPWRPFVGLYLDRMAPLSFGCAGIDGPGLTPLAAPVPAEVLDGLVDVVGHDMDVGGLSGSTHGDVSEFSAAAVGVQVGAVSSSALASVNGRGVSQGEFGRVLSGRAPGCCHHLHPRREADGIGVNGDDLAPLRGDRLSVGPWCYPGPDSAFDPGSCSTWPWTAWSS
jgi:hypothetical protein